MMAARCTACRLRRWACAIFFLLRVAANEPGAAEDGERDLHQDHSHFTVGILYPKPRSEVVLNEARRWTGVAFLENNAPSERYLTFSVSLDGGASVDVPVDQTLASTTISLLLDTLPAGRHNVEVFGTSDDGFRHSAKTDFVVLKPTAMILSAEPNHWGDHRKSALIDLRFDTTGGDRLLCDNDNLMAAAVFVNGHYAGVTKSKWVRISRILVNRKWAPLCSLEVENHYNVTVRLLSSDQGLLFNGDKDNAIKVESHGWGNLDCDMSSIAESVKWRNLEPWATSMERQSKVACSVSEMDHPVDLWPKRFAFSFGLAKSGTTSTRSALEEKGINVIHGAADQVRYLTCRRVVDIMYDAIEEGMEVFAYLTHWDVISPAFEVHHPQIEYLELITDQYPDSMFFVNKRNLTSHQNSMKKRIDSTDGPRGPVTLNEALKNHYPSPRFRRPTWVPGIPRTGATDGDILKWLGGYYQFLRDHFDSLEIPTSFLEFDILDDWGELLGNFLHVEGLRILHINETPHGGHIH